jgi:hypothetical protein
MSPPLKPLAPAIAHPDDAVSGLASLKIEAHRPESKPTETVAPTQAIQAPLQVRPQVTLALSFAFDNVTQSLNVIMTDKNSGEVVRKVSYKNLPTDVHKAEKLNGLLLDQFA